MSDFKNVMKHGWHPKGKDGGKESWRGDFKGINQVAGWVGKGKTTETQAAREHVSRPLASLKDPAAFGPPPKNVNYHGGAALPNEITPHTGGLGAPLTQSQRAPANQLYQEEEEEPAKPQPPALPYRANATGLRTDTLPPPPVRRDTAQTAAVRPPPPLPVRQNIASPPANDPSPPSYDTVTAKPTSNSYLNQSAVKNLGRAGVNVPGLGIGNPNGSNPWKDEESPSQGPGTNQLSELQSRFSKMRHSPQNTDASSPITQSESPSQAAVPSWKQSQSALQTAQNLRTNPQNVSLADAQSAAQTAGQAQRSVSAFREKHADSIANAQAKAKAWDQRYKVTSKINKFLDEHSDPDPSQPQPQPQNADGQQSHQPAPAASGYSSPPPVPQHPNATQQPTPAAPTSDFPAASISRKPPPPPAPRKPANLQAPPPVPTGTKPSLG